MIIFLIWLIVFVVILAWSIYMYSDGGRDDFGFGLLMIIGLWAILELIWTVIVLVIALFIY